MSKKRKFQKTERESGIVKWFENSTGYGFVQQDNGEYVYVHNSAIHGDGFRSLADGQRVEFDVDEGVKDPEAQNV